MKTLTSILIAAVLFLAGAPALAQPPIVNGWTQFAASSDSRVVYVSPAGNDANSGLSASLPKRTIAAGAALIRDGFPDWLLLESGRTWHESFPSWTKGGRSAAEPMRIGVFGGSERATLLTGTTQGLGGFVAGMTPKSHLAITDLAFVEDGYNGGNSNAAGVQFLGSWSDVLLENVSIDGYLTNLVFQSDRTQQLMQDIRIRRCVITDSYTTGSAHSEGCYLAGIDRLLLEECAFDHNGWNESVAGAAPDIFRHNIYIQGHDGNYDDCTNVTTRRLISARAAATGMQQRPGGECDNNLFVANPLNVVFGTTGGTLTDCVVVGSRDIGPGLERGVGYNLVNGQDMTAIRCIAAGLPSGMGTANVYAYAIDTATNVVLQSCVSWRWTSAVGSGTAVHWQGAPEPTVSGGNMEQTPPAYTVSVEAYAAAHGIDEAAWYAGIRSQSRATWNMVFTAGAFNTWARAAFGISSPADCWVNCDGSTQAPILNLADFTCYLDKFASGSPAANCDGSTQGPALNIADFTCFLQKFAAGCN